MLLVDVHELEVILGDSVVGLALEHQVENVGRILSLEGQDVIVLGSAEDLGEGGEVNAEGNVAIAAERFKAFCLEQHSDQGDVAVIHGLEGDAAVIAVEVAVLHEVLDRIDDLQPGKQSDVIITIGEPLDKHGVPS